MAPPGRNWLKRGAVVAVGMPSAIQILKSSFATFFALLILLILSLVEFRTNICPPILMGHRSRDKGNQGYVSVTWFLPFVGASSAAALQFAQDIVSIDSITTLVYIVVFIHHVVYRYTFGLRWNVNSAVSHPSILDFVNLSLDLVGVTYIIRGFLYTISLRSVSNYGPGYQVLGCMCMWNTDNGGIIFGSFLGGKKLIPSVSPGKTVMGVVGGLLCSMATAVAVQSLSQLGYMGMAALPAWPIVTTVLVGLVLGIAAVLGDLVESFIKRIAGVKDSGVFFPGHGGCLDRFDSMLFVMPLLNTLCQSMLVPWYEVVE